MPVPVTIANITEKLQGLPEEKLAAVYHFAAYLAERETAEFSDVTARELMLAVEPLLRSTWDTPDEDEAWAHL